MKKNVLVLLSALISSFILILSGFRVIIFDQDLYKKEFLRHNVYNNLQSKELVDENLSLLINFLKNKNTRLETGFFNEKEKSNKEINFIFIFFDYLSDINIFLFYL